MACTAELMNRQIDHWRYKIVTCWFRDYLSICVKDNIIFNKLHVIIEKIIIVNRTKRPIWITMKSYRVLIIFKSHRHNSLKIPFNAFTYNSSSCKFSSTKNYLFNLQKMTKTGDFVQTIQSPHALPSSYITNG